MQSQQLGFPPAQLNIRSSAKLSAPIAKLMVQAMPPVILEASRPPIRGEKGAHGHADHVFDTII